MEAAKEDIIAIINREIKKIKDRLLLKTSYFEETILRHQIIDLLFKRQRAESKKLV